MERGMSTRSLSNYSPHVILARSTLHEAHASLGDVSHEGSINVMAHFIYDIKNHTM